MFLLHHYIFIMQMLDWVGRIRIINVLIWGYFSLLFPRQQEYSEYDWQKLDINFYDHSPKFRRWNCGKTSKNLVCFICWLNVYCVCCYNFLESIFYFPYTFQIESQWIKMCILICWVMLIWYYKFTVTRHYSRNNLVYYLALYGLYLMFKDLHYWITKFIF